MTAISSPPERPESRVFRDDELPAPRRARTGHAVNVPYRWTPTDIADWEAGLSERTQMCADIAGKPRAILTLYAGPDDRGGRPVAVITGIDHATYVSRADEHTDTASWIRSLLEAIESQSPTFQPNEPLLGIRSRQNGAKGDR